ncbi:MAG: cold shock domain-containing protein [Saprospiraceae bacterium]|jgi:CspA family cold shock protein|nr:cold shock domain-containing protein [Saprospiraceae bacterium]
MSIGTVKFFDKTKGFGFISPDDGSKDVFVHQNSLTVDIAEGDKVSYDVEESPKGLNAVHVKLA